MNRKSKKYSQKPSGFIGIFTCDSKRVTVSGYLRVSECVIVAYYCVWMCGWHIVYMYVKLHIQSIDFTGHIYIYILLLLYILNTLLIILHLVRYKPTKWFSDNQHCYIYIYIYKQNIGTCKFSSEILKEIVSIWGNGDERVEEETKKETFYYKYHLSSFSRWFFNVLR